MTIRRVPEDFRVIEVLAPRALARLGVRTPRSKWGVYQITKTKLTTPDVAQRLAKLVGCPAGKVGWAGLKDKYAVTTQVMSVPAVQTLPERVEGVGFSGELMGWSEDELCAASIAGNRFEIVVRDLSKHAAEAMASRLATLRDSDGEVWMVNYYGEQRFTSARHGKGFAGEKLIRGDFDGALRLLIGTPARKDSPTRHEFSRAAANLWGKWSELLAVFPKCPERRAIEALAAGKSVVEAFTSLPYLDQQMAVEAYQSHLWNRSAERLVRSIARAEQVLIAADAYGEIAFAPLESNWRNEMLPVPAHDVDMSRLMPEVQRAVDAALRDVGVTLEQLRIKEVRRPAFSTVGRPLCMRVADLELSAIERDDMTTGSRYKRAIKFRLGTGSYATVVLRAIGQ
ncbi:MAG: tRNA pseudouridine(13) synthase TruD [Planctomycetes bacterium]|nr:tRNA pseudouridine(13) synthase TruD [Planctomycetota bacterium]